MKYSLVTIDDILYAFSKFKEHQTGDGIMMPGEVDALKNAFYRNKQIPQEVAEFANKRKQRNIWTEYAWSENGK